MVRFYKRGDVYTKYRNIILEYNDVIRAKCESQWRHIYKNNIKLSNKMSIEL